MTLVFNGSNTIDLDLPKLAKDMYYIRIKNKSDPPVLKLIIR